MQEYKELVNRVVSNIFETNPILEQEGIPGPASYFYIVIELDNTELFELGIHDIKKWTRKEKLIPFEKPPWAEQNNYTVIGQKIKKVIERDPEEYYDGSLSVLLENGIYFEHQSTNGDQLFIDLFNEE